MSAFTTILYFWLAFSIQFISSVANPTTKKRSQVRPAPVVFPPSQGFKGPDGEWSTFYLQIGTPPQIAEVQISTKSYQTIVVLPGGCISTDPITCPSDRGGQRDLFNPNSSTSWKANTVVPNSTFTLNLNTRLGYNANGLYGYDKITLGIDGGGGPSLDQQIVAGIETKDFYLGFFGLNPRPTNFTTFNNPVPSFLTSLRESNEIPSLSWGYTAGNAYWPGTALGSLTLGGFDTGRFIPSKVTFPFHPVEERDLTVIVNSIKFESTTGPGLMGYGIESPANIAAVIDSTTPYFWLPLAACQAFERAFGLSWNESVQGYLVNDTLHESLQQQDASITFSLATPNGTDGVDIKLPYAAFDLKAVSPVLANESRFFPLVRATNDTEYTLGRAFLQEAYVIADYERRSFSVNQCRYPMGPERIVAIESIDEEGSQTSSKISPGAIAGIVVGGIAAFALVVLFGFVMKKRGRAMLRLKLHPEMNELGGDGSSIYGEIKKFSGRLEIDGDSGPGPELDGVGLIGHEIGGHHYHGQELEDNVPRHELDTGGNVKHELPAHQPQVYDTPQSPQSPNGEASSRSSARSP